MTDGSIDLQVRAPLVTAMELGPIAMKVRRTFRKRGVPIYHNTCLEGHLAAAESQARLRSENGSASDEVKMAVASQCLVAVKIAMSLEMLPKNARLRERMRFLARRGVEQEQEEQFVEAAFELYCASELKRDGCDVRIVPQKPPKRGKKTRIS